MRLQQRNTCTPSIHRFDGKAEVQGHNSHLTFPESKIRGSSTLTQPGRPANIELNESSFSVP